MPTRSICYFVQIVNDFNKNMMHIHFMTLSIQKQTLVIHAQRVIRSLHDNYQAPHRCFQQMMTK